MDKPKANADEPQFDPDTAAEMQSAALMKLQSVLKARQDAAQASSSKEFAVRCVRGLESTINQLFDVGANTQDVLTHLLQALPSIPADDLRHALKTLRVRNKKLRMAKSQPTSEQGTAITKNSRQPAPKPQPLTKTIKASSDLPAWADGSDRLPGESDDDYRLRKEIEGPPEARQKFIGEQ